MQKKLLCLWILSLSFFMCGCNNSQPTETVQTDDYQCTENTEECDSETPAAHEENNTIEEDMIPIAEKLEWDNQITTSEWDLNSETVPESDVFEEPIG